MEVKRFIGSTVISEKVILRFKGQLGKNLLDETGTFYDNTKFLINDVYQITPIKLTNEII